MADCWYVVDWLRKRWGQFELVAGLEWHCGTEHIKPPGSGETAALAICRAALLVALEDKSGM